VLVNLPWGGESAAEVHGKGLFHALSVPWTSRSGHCSSWKSQTLLQGSATLPPAHLQLLPSLWLVSTCSGCYWSSV